jgi:transposase-like protein
MQRRGVQDILIASIDNLNGFSQAIKSVFPKTGVQLYIIPQIMSSLKYIAHEDCRTVIASLKEIYQASDKK